MKISKLTPLISPFVLTEEEVEKIYLILHKFSGNVQIKINCKDDLIREYDDLEHFLEYENVKKKQIVSLTFSAYGHDEYSGRYVFLTFSSSSFNNIYIHMEGPEDETIKLNDKFYERLESLQPWYSFFSKVEFMYVTFGLFFSYYIVILILALLGFIKIETENITDKTRIIAAFVGTLPVILGFILNNIKGKLFPLSTFAINQGLQRFKNLESFRYVILGGLSVTLLGGVILSLIL